MSAKLIQVIEVETHRGQGVVGDPSRIVVQYYSPDGTLLAERDAWRDEQEAERRMLDIVHTRP